VGWLADGERVMRPNSHQMKMRKGRKSREEDEIAIDKLTTVE
jgi:hypothetical protein